MASDVAVVEVLERARGRREKSRKSLPDAGRANAPAHATERFKAPSHATDQMCAAPPSPAGVRDAWEHQSRHVASASDNYEEPQLIRSEPPPWRTVGALAAAAGVLLLCGLEWTAAVVLAAATRLGPLNLALMHLPEVHSRADFENRHYRVNQSLWLISICCSIYTLIPEEFAKQQMQGWKMNLVTMETSMASGIAATYGYSVAGGVPGGLLAEYVLSIVGKQAVLEVEPFVGKKIAKSGVSFFLFMVMGSFMESLAQIAYAFAHQREPSRAPPSPRVQPPAEKKYN